MPVHRFHCPELAAGTLHLPTPEAHHAADVLRLTAGARIVVFDGAGREADAIVVERSARHLVVEAGEVRTRTFELPIRITVAVALPRVHRQVFLVEKCTELGMAAMWPIVCERSVVKPKTQRAAKLTRHAIDAAKQAGRAWVPTVVPPMPLGDALTRTREFDAAYWLSPGGAGLMHALSGAPRCACVVVFVGPEGGWTTAEEESATAAGAVPINLGPNVLRVETAAVAIVATIAAHATRGVEVQ